MVIIAKAQKGQEYMYKMSSMIKCRGRAQAERVASFLTKHNDRVENTDLRLGDNELWHMYTIDKYSPQPHYSTKTKKGQLVITRIM